MHQLIYHFLASGCADPDSIGGCTSSGTSQIWSTDIGGFIGAILAALGILVLVGAVVKGVADALSGKLGKTFKVIIGALILSAFMIEPGLFGDLVSLGATVVKDVINSITQLTGGGSSGGGSTTTTTVPGA